MAHRNMARVKDALGDTLSALEHNTKAMSIEANIYSTDVSNLPSSVKTTLNSSAYRSAAIQMITKGGGISQNGMSRSIQSQETAVKLITMARSIENKNVILPTTQRTNEILMMIAKRTGDKKAELERDKKIIEDKMQNELEEKRGKYSGLIRSKGDDF